MQLIDTIPDMVSPDYKKRFVAEYNQLNIRLEKILDIINKFEKDNLGFKLNTPIVFLEIQARHMLDYKEILLRRAMIEEIDLDQEEFK